MKLINYPEPSTWSELLKRPVMSTEGLFDTVRGYSERFAAKKRARGLVDYSDLEHKALELLVDGDGQIRGLYEGTKDKDIDKLINDIDRLMHE